MKVSWKWFYSGQILNPTKQYFIVRIVVNKCRKIQNHAGQLYAKISAEVGSPKTGPAPRPSLAPPRARVSSKTWSCGTIGTARSSLGMLGAGQGPSDREEEPPGVVGEASCWVQPDLQPTQFPSPIRVGSEGILLFVFSNLTNFQWLYWKILRQRLQIKKLNFSEEIL